MDTSTLNLIAKYWEKLKCNRRITKHIKLSLTIDSPTPIEPMNECFLFGFARGGIRGPEHAHSTMKLQPQTLYKSCFFKCVCVCRCTFGVRHMSVPVEVIGQPWVVPSTSFGKGSLIGLELTNYASLAQWVPGIPLFRLPSVRIKNGLACPHTQRFPWLLRGNQSKDRPSWVRSFSMYFLFCCYCLLRGLELLTLLLQPLGCWDHRGVLVNSLSERAALWGG